MLRLADDADDVAMPDLIRMTDLPMLSALAIGSIGRAHFYLGNAEEARDWLERGLEAPGGSYGPYRVHMLGSLALVEAWEGRLVRAAELADEALELARELQLLNHPAPADAYLARALVAIQRGEPEAGAFALHEGHVRASSNGRVQLLWIAHAESSLVDPEGTDAAAVPPTGTPPPPLRARRAARAGPAAGAADAAARRRAGAEIDWSALLFEDIAGLLASRDAGRGTPAAACRCPPRATPAPLQLVERDILLAWLERCRGPSGGVATAAGGRARRRPRARAWCIRSSAAGAHVEELLRALPGQPTGFRRAVLDRFAPTPRPDAEQLVEPLTARELELLAYLPSRLTNSELAARCFVSVNTVKTHMAHIYRKLDASGRDAAIARARELGLLDSADIARVG